MNRKRILLENFVVYGIGGVVSRAIPFIMMPIITYLLPDEAFFGVNDLFNTVTALCCSVGLMGMTDTMYRFFFDNEDENYRVGICTTTAFIAFFFTIISTLILLLSGRVIVNKLYGSSDYYYLIGFNVLAVFSGNISSLFSLPTRMLNRKKSYLMVNTIVPIVTYTVALSLILNGWYISALPLAVVTSNCFSAFVWGIKNKRWFSPWKINMSLSGSLIKYGIPLMPQHLIYFVMNSCDKWMIALCLGQRFNGLYAVGSKFGQVSQLIYTAYASGWVYYRYVTMKEPDQIENTSLIFDVIGYISLLAFVVCCVFSKAFIGIAFKESYAESYIVIPYLFLAPLIQILFQTAAGQFLIIKNTWANLVFLIIGVLCNVYLNYAMIPRMGIEGAAIATLIGYTITLLLCVSVCVKKRLLIISKRLCLCVFMTGSFFGIWRFHVDQPIIFLPVALICFVGMTSLYAKDFRQLLFNRKKDS